MSKLSGLLLRLRRTLHHRRHQAEMAAEMQTHVELETERRIALGENPTTARRRAAATFGSVDARTEQVRDARLGAWLDQTWQDLRYAARQLRKSPGFTAIAIASLAIGIGANTTLFSLIHSILLGSLPVPHPQELREVRWQGTEPQIGTMTGSSNPVGPIEPDTSGDSLFPTSKRVQIDAFRYPDFEYLRAGIAPQADLFGYLDLRDINARGRHGAESLDGLMVSDNFFSGLSVQPQAGRLFLPDDDAGRNGPITVISHALWTREFQQDPAAVGETLTLNGSVFTIVGVLPPAFFGLNVESQIDFYVPMSAQPTLAPSWSRTDPGRWWVHLFARLAPDAPETLVQRNLDLLFAPLVAENMTAPQIDLLPGHAGVTFHQQRLRRPLLILFGVVTLVVLVACANLAGLSLARGVARQHEFAVRSALGSGSWRLVRQSLTESLLLAGAGGFGGLLLSLWGKFALARLLFAQTRGGLHYDLSLDHTVLAFTFGLTLLTVLLAGLLPAWRSSRVDPLDGLKSRGMLSSPRLRLGRALVVIQLTLSVLLVTGAGLYGRTLVNLAHLNPGFAIERLLIGQLSPHAIGIRGAELTTYLTRVQEDLARLPGVRAVTLSQFQLLGGWMSGGSFFTLPAHPELVDERKPRAHRLTVGDRFFATMDIPISLGREFTAADAAGAPGVVVVNQAFADTYFPTELPLNQSLRIGDEEWRIVGVCGNAQYASLKGDPPPTVYFSYRQRGLGSAYIVLRTQADPLPLAPAVRKTLAAIDDRVPLNGITTQAALFKRNFAQERLFALLVGALAGLTALLTAIGLYGLMAYHVSRRRSEFGVRMALGARPQDIARPVLGEAVRLGLIGIAIAGPIAFGLGRFIRHQLYGVSLVDPIALAVALLGLPLVAVLAAWLPARRAAKADPLTALRSE